MSIIHTILEGVKKITAEQIACSVIDCPPPREGETVIGIVLSPTAKALWALAHEYDRQSDLAEHSYRFDHHSDTGRQHLERLSTRYASLCKAARSLAFIEMRDEAGEAGWTDVVCLRKDFTLVVSQEQTTTAMVELPGIPQELLKALFEKLRGTAGAVEVADDSKAKKRKPS